jgi:hypothetical protein
LPFKKLNTVMIQQSPMPEFRRLIIKSGFCLASLPCSTLVVDKRNVYVLIIYLCYFRLQHAKGAVFTTVQITVNILIRFYNSNVLFVSGSRYKPLYLSDQAALRKSPSFPVIGGKRTPHSDQKDIKNLQQVCKKEI